VRFFVRFGDKSSTQIYDRWIPARFGAEIQARTLR